MGTIHPLLREDAQDRKDDLQDSDRQNNAKAGAGRQELAHGPPPTRERGLGCTGSKAGMALPLLRPSL